MTTTYRTLFARLALAAVPSLVAACATDPADPGEPMPEEPTPEQPMPEQPMPTPLAAGELDPAFGTGGVLALDVGPAYAAAIDVQGDKLVACVTHIDGAAWTARVIRLDTTGSIDMTFGTNGRVTIGDVGNVGCQDITTTADGRIAVGVYKQATGNRVVTWVTPDGDILGTFGNLGPGTKIGRSEHEPMAITYGAVFTNKIAVGEVMAGTFESVENGPAADLVVRGYRDAAGTWSVVGRLLDNGVPTWQVAKATNALAPLGPGARAAAGTDTPDLLSDAIRLPDGSYFAVGGMDSDLEVMAARFVDGGSPTVDVEHHAVGGVSGARAIALDGADRPVVVGKGSDAGKTVFAWQRYAASSVTLDASYQGDGIATVAAPSGQGELLDVVRLNGALYAIGSYDVETASPKVALVKIAE